MSSIACYINNNAQLVRLLTPGSDSKWVPSNDLDENDAFALRNRLADAANWLTSAVGSKKRIDLVCLGVSDTMCRWLTAPSAEPSVIAAAARGKGEEWGPGAGFGTIEPLTSPHRKAPKPGAGSRDESHFPVLTIRDAPTRVLLDDLDANGVRVGSVITFWHAMCRAWDETLPIDRAREELSGGSDNGDTELAAASPITAILTTTEDNSIAWAWSRGRRMITGGRAATPHTEHTDSPEPTAGAQTYDDAFGRIALDWLTWSAQLGQAPDRIIIISPDADAIAGQCDRLWPAAPHRQIPEIDPVAATLNRLISADHIKPESDARTCVATLTNRPGRAHRKLNQWVGVILLASAVGVIGLGWRFQRQSRDYRKQEQGFQATITEKLSVIDDRLARDPRPVRALENRINELAEGTEGFVEPESPLPILGEVLRVAKSLENTEGVTVERIEITESRSTLRLLIPDTATGEQIIEALRTSDGDIRWIESTAGSLTGRIIFNGAWTLEDERL